MKILKNRSKNSLNSRLSTIALKNTEENTYMTIENKSGYTTIKASFDEFVSYMKTKKEYTLLSYSNKKAYVYHAKQRVAMIHKYPPEIE